MTDERAGFQRQVLRLALPAAGEYLIRFASAIIDTVLMGHLGAEALTVLGLSNQLILVGVVFVTPVTVGGGVLIAQSFGASENRRAHLIFAQSLWLGLVISLSLVVLGMAFATSALQFMGAEATVVRMGTTFLRLFLLTLPIHYFTLVVNSCLRGAGDTSTPFLVIIIETLVRTLSAWILVNGLFGFPALDASGVAIGALVGQSVGAGILVYLLWRGRLLLRLRALPLQLDLPLTKALLKLGIPSGGEQLGLRLGQIINVRLITGLGTVGFAAYLVGFNSISVALAVGVGFAMAATTIVGQSIGAGRALQAREGAKQTWILGIVAMGAIGALLFIGAEWIIRFFTDDERVIEMAVFPLKVVALILPAEATNQVLSGAFRGAGDTRWPFLLTTAGNFLLRIPLTFLLIGRFGLLGVWIALMVEISIRAGLNARRFLRLDWRTSVDPVSIGATG